MFVPSPDLGRQPPPPFDEEEMAAYLARIGLAFSKAVFRNAEGVEGFEWTMHYGPDPQGHCHDGNPHDNLNDFWAEFSSSGRSCVNFHFEVLEMQDEYLSANKSMRVRMERWLDPGDTEEVRMADLFTRTRRLHPRYEYPSMKEYFRRSTEGDHGDVRWMDDLLTLGPGYVYVSEIPDWPDHILFVMQAFVKKVTADEEAALLGRSLPGAAGVSYAKRDRL